MAQGKRLHLSYERMALMLDSCPAFKSLGKIEPVVMNRIQSISYSFNYNAIRNTEIGSHEYIKHRTYENGLEYSRVPIVTQPDVSLNFNYLLYDFSNETKMGFNIGAEGIFNYDSYDPADKNRLYSRPDWASAGYGAVPDKGDLNFYVVADDTSERRDVIGGRGEQDTFDGLDILGFGNCYITDYTIEASLGSFVQCSAQYACSNLTYDIYDTYDMPKCPAVDGGGVRSTAEVDLPTFEMSSSFIEYPNDAGESLILRPGDVEVKLINNKPDSEGGFYLLDLNKDDVSVQSISFNIPVGRTDINGFGSDYINDRKMQFPVMCTADISVSIRNFEGSGDIGKIFRDDVDCDIEVDMYVRQSLAHKKKKVRIIAKNAKLNGESHDYQIGSFSTLQASFLFEVTHKGGFSMELM
jgi:hypothetical protein